MVRYRHTASFGKRQEFIAIAELLRRGFDVYQTLVDDQQIDCVIRKEVSGNPVYLDIQIKARSKMLIRDHGENGPVSIFGAPDETSSSSSTPSLLIAIGLFLP